MAINNNPTMSNLEGFANIVAAVKARLWKEILYELQTGGGICFANVSRSGDSDQVKLQLEAIRVALGRLKGMLGSAAARVASRLSHPNLRVLDVGAGRAPWSRAIASCDLNASVTAIDLPDQMTTLRDAVSAAGLSGQFRLVAIDVFSSAWPIGPEYDLVLVANVCHLFDGQHNRELLRRVALCLRPGGTLAIIDQVLDEDPDWARWGALYALGALHCAPGGQLFPIRVYANWLRELGFRDVEQHAVCPLPPLTLITAHWTK